MPRHVRRMAIRLLVDVGRGGDERESKQNDTRGKTPSAIRLGGNVSIDMVGHGGEYIARQRSVGSERLVTLRASSMATVDRGRAEEFGNRNVNVGIR